jgi:hypothetical protein
LGETKKNQTKPNTKQYPNQTKTKPKPNTKLKPKSNQNQTQTKYKTKSKSNQNQTQTKYKTKNQIKLNKQTGFYIKLIRKIKLFCNKRYTSLIDTSLFIMVYNNTITQSLS